MKKRIVTILAAVVCLAGQAAVSTAAPLWLDNVDFTSGWFDVNKTGTDDTLLCWAASASNILSYTEWWGGPDLVTETQIFNSYKSYWNDDTGSPYYAVDWWFTGDNDRQGDTDWAQLTDTSHTGFFTSALFNTNYSWTSYSAFSDIYSYIEQDRGTSLRIAKGQQGHFLTVWGVDATLNRIWVTDSDPAGLNVDETLDVYDIAADGSFTYGTYTWYISEVHGLLPNSDNIPPVPEPSTLFLILAGLLVFLLLEREGHFKK